MINTSPDEISSGFGTSICSLVREPTQSQYNFPFVLQHRYLNLTFTFPLTHSLVHGFLYVLNIIPPLTQYVPHVAL